MRSIAGACGKWKDSQKKNEDRGKQCEKILNRKCLVFYHLIEKCKIN